LSNSDGYIFAGTGEDGILKTTVNGTWLESNNGINNLDVQSIVYDKENNLYAGTITSGLFSSNNDSPVWQKSGIGIDTKNIMSLSVDSNNYIYAGTYGVGVYKSTDKGNTFTQMNEGLIDKNIFSMVVDTGNHVFVGTGGSGIYMYEPDSSKWIRRNDGLKHLVVYSLSKSQNGYLYAATPGGGVFKSQNNGDSWTQINSNLTNLFVNTVVSLNDTTLIVGTQNAGAFITYDIGNSWQNIGLAGKDIRSIVFAPDSFLYVATRDNGIYKAKLDDFNWQLFNDGLITNSTQFLICDKKGRLFAAPHRNGIYYYETITGVSDVFLNNNSEIEIYPNPATDKIIIKLNLKYGFDELISIYNIIGLSIKNLEINTLQDCYELQIDYLPDGIYFIKYNKIIQTFIISK
ncbi:MAG: T9SS type A sorting domain-containing protein, partial [Ignavibacteriae bacterium]|nr:T9SS type A sorting domain-containing protein [Ignavibacteriota bacterium]